MGVFELHFYGPIDGHIYGEVCFYVSFVFRPSAGNQLGLSVCAVVV